MQVITAALVKPDHTHAAAFDHTSPMLASPSPQVVRTYSIQSSLSRRVSDAINRLESTQSLESQHSSTGSLPLHSSPSHQLQLQPSSQNITLAAPDLGHDADSAELSSQEKRSQHGDRQLDVKSIAQQHTASQPHPSESAGSASVDIAKLCCPSRERSGDHQELGPACCGCFGCECEQKTCSRCKQSRFSQWLQGVLDLFSCGTGSCIHLEE